MNKKKSLLLSILTGILIGTSIIPFPPWAMFFCFVPIFYFWIYEKPKQAFLFTFIAFGIASLIGFFWITNVVHKFAYIPLPISVLICCFVAFLYHLPLAFAGYIYARWLRPLSSLPILSATTFFSIIWYLSPMLFDWNFGLGWLYGGLPAYHFMDIFGAYFFHALSVFINGFLLFLFLDFKKRKILIAPLVGFFILLNTAGFFYGKSQIKSNKQIGLVIGQGNIGNLEKRYQMNHRTYKIDSLLDYFKGSNQGFEKAQGKKVDFLVWPETAIPEFYSPYFARSTVGSQLLFYLKEKDVHLISGAYSQTTSRKTANSMIFLNKDGLDLASPLYKKILLIFGEYLPGESFFPILRKWLPTVGDFEAGPSPEVRSVAGTQIGGQICYEALFPSFSRALALKGAEVIVNLSNDSWYGNYSEPSQHLYSTVLRAVETRLPIVRSTNTGISTVILPSGKVLEQSPREEIWGGFYEVPYQSNPTKTIYVRWGYFLTLPLLLIVFIISLIYGKNRS